MIHTASNWPQNDNQTKSVIRTFLSLTLLFSLPFLSISQFSVFSCSLTHIAGSVVNQPTAGKKQEKGKALSIWIIITLL